jgi:hypothetical protein
MTPEEFGKARAELGLSGETMGTWMGATGRSIRRWEAKGGEGPPRFASIIVAYWLQDLRVGRWPTHSFKAVSVQDLGTGEVAPRA